MFEIRFNGSLQRYEFSTLFSVVSRKHVIVRSHPIIDNHADKAGTAHVPIIAQINRWMDRSIARGVNQNGSETTHSRYILPRYVSINPADLPRGDRLPPIPIKFLFPLFATGKIR